MNYKTKLTSVMLSMTTAVLLTGSAAIPLVANAALTQAQIQSILSLLSSFGADQTTINNVNSSLMGLPTSGAPTASAGACGFTRDLTMGARGDDVTCLQNYLRYFSLGSMFGFTLLWKQYFPSGWVHEEPPYGYA